MSPKKFIIAVQNRIYSRIGFLDGVPLLALRLFLAPVMIVAGWHKFEDLEATIVGFGHLGIPFAEILTPIAAGTELFGGIFLLLGFATRLIAIPLAMTMVVAALTVHLGNGWFAIAPTNATTSPARPLAVLGIPMAKESLALAAGTRERVSQIRATVDQHARATWLKERGRVVVLQNGIEYATTYLIMLLVLCFYGGGRYCSLDYHIFKDVDSTFWR